MSAALLKLERFDGASLLAGPAEHDVKTQQARAEAYSEGYAAGVASASAKTGERERLMASVAALIEAEASAAPVRLQEQAVAATRVIIEKIFPTLTRAGFAVEAAAALSSLMKTGASPMLQITTSPEHAKSLAALLKDMSPDAAISVRGDADITDAAAKADWTGGGVEFDLDRAAAQCLAALENAIGKASNGKSS